VHLHLEIKKRPRKKSFILEIVAFPQNKCKSKCRHTWKELTTHWLRNFDLEQAWPNWCPRTACGSQYWLKMCNLICWPLIDKILSKNENNEPKNMLSFFAAPNNILVFQFGSRVKMSCHPWSWGCYWSNLVGQHFFIILEKFRGSKTGLGNVWPTGHMRPPSI